MKNIVMYGSFIEYNLGLPSLLHGAEELLCRIFGEDNVNFVYYESNKLGGRILDNFKSKIKYTPFENSKVMLKSAIKYRLTKRCKKEEEDFFADLKSADYIVDIYGICFCSKLEKSPMSSFKARYSALMQFTIPYIAKWFNKKVINIKTAASYGPFNTKGLNIKAEFAVNKIFDCVFSREKQSAQALYNSCNVNKEILISPDLANIMRYEQAEYGANKQIAVVVSHQLETQWKENGDYKQQVIGLLKHIANKLPEYKIIMIPNETSPFKKYNDISVAERIKELSGLAERLVVLSGPDLNAVEIKNEIAQSDLVISARYHSCVAALSSATPTLVMGWHYKYDELLELYGQKEWIVSDMQDSEKNLILKFDDLWEKRAGVHEELLCAFANVQNALYNSYKNVFAVKD